MKKLGLVLAAAAMVAFASGSAMAGNGAPSGAHYNLNLIGVDKGKNPDMKGGNAHRIFIWLGKNSQPITNIWLFPSEDFVVCDGNGTDEAYDCDGNLIDSKAGASFGLPCNTNLPVLGVDKKGNPILENIDCNEVVNTKGRTDLPEAHYEVWVRVLGSPQGNPTIEVVTCATVQGELDCSTENEILTRTTGKSEFTDVTNELTSIVVAYCFHGLTTSTVASCDADGGTVKLTRIALFSGDTEDWFWEWDNNGVRLAQLRFYEVPE